MLLLNGLSVAFKAMGRSFKSNLMFIYNQPYVLAQSTLCLFQTIRRFFMQMTARLFIIMHINS